MACGSERLQILGLSKLESPADWQNHHRTQYRTRADVATTRRRRRRLRALPWSWDSDSDLDGPATQVGRSERSCPVTQMDASSDEEVLVSSNHGRRVVPRTEHEFPTSGTTASSQALARVQHVSREVENGNDEDQLRIGQHRNVCARVGDSHDRAEPQEPSVSGSLVRGNFARGPAVDVQNRFSALRVGLVVHEVQLLIVTEWWNLPTQWSIPRSFRHIV